MIIRVGANLRKHKQTQKTFATPHRIFCHPFTAMPFSLPLNSLVSYKAEATSKWAWEACAPKLNEDGVLDIKILYVLDGSVYYREETGDGSIVFRLGGEEEEERRRRKTTTLDLLKLLIYQQH